MKNFRLAAVAALSALVLPFQSHATLGIFEHGSGIKSMGMGGIAYGYADETTALGANPAHLFSLGHRFDIGADVFTPQASARFEGNAAGPDESYRNTGHRVFWVPQGGMSFPLSERWAAGFTLINAGLGPDYDTSPYQRFGGARRVTLMLGSSSLVGALAYRPSPDQSIAASLNLGYQTLNIKGLQFLQSESLSQAPDKVTNQGTDGSFSVGFSLGWKGRITPWLSAGVGYRSKSWTEKHHEYEGTLPDGGSLELPAVYGAGFALTPRPDLRLAFDYQRLQNKSERALGNPISNLFEEGKRLGSHDGPGFGLRNQNAYKLGVDWSLSPKLTLRAGYIDTSQTVRSSDTLFGILGPVMLTEHYTVGATYLFETWELSGFATHVTDQDVHGHNSLPAALGGGEVNVSNEVYGFGISVGRRFGK